MSDLCYKIILGSMSLAGGQGGQDLPICGSQRSWDWSQLRRSTLPGPWAASTIAVLIVHWHCQHFGTDLIPPFRPFLLLALIFCFSFLLVPSLNQAALFLALKRSKAAWRLWTFGHRLRSHDRGWGNKMTQGLKRIWKKRKNLSHRIWNKLGFYWTTTQSLAKGQKKSWKGSHAFFRLTQCKKPTSVSAKLYPLGEGRILHYNNYLMTEENLCLRVPLNPSFQITSTTEELFPIFSSLFQSSGNNCSSYIH